MNKPKTVQVIAINTGFKMKIKTVKILFFVLGLSCLGSSCEDDYTLQEYTIENQSGVPITFKLYTQMKRTDQSIQNIRYVPFAPGEQRTVSVDTPVFSFAAFFDNISREDYRDMAFNTLEVIYNEEKSTTWIETYQNDKGECKTIFEEKTSCNDRNLLNRSFYNRRKEHFVFTKADYEAATPLQEATVEPEELKKN